MEKYSTLIEDTYDLLEHNMRIALYVKGIIDDSIPDSETVSNLNIEDLLSYCPKGIIDIHNILTGRLKRIRDNNIELYT